MSALAEELKRGDGRSESVSEDMVHMWKSAVSIIQWDGQEPCIFCGIRLTYAFSVLLAAVDAAALSCADKHEMVVLIEEQTLIQFDQAREALEDKLM